MLELGFLRGHQEGRRSSQATTGEYISAPPATLLGVTAQSRTALGNREELRLSRLPFKVGREARLNPRAPFENQIHHRLSSVPQLNDLYLVEPASADRLHISREHFLIDWREGRFVIVDRESACGTIVGDVRLGGGENALEADLNDGDRIVVGGDDSPFVFLFRTTSQD